MSHYKGGVTVQKSIRTIQAEPTLPTRLRVAAYARVSSDKDTMLHSLAEQVSKYSRMIQSNPVWEYAGVYAEMLTPSLIQMHPACTQIAP